MSQHFTPKDALSFLANNWSGTLMHALPLLTNWKSSISTWAVLCSLLFMTIFVSLSVTWHNFGFPQLALHLCGASTCDILQSTIMVSKRIINASISLENIWFAMCQVELRETKILDGSKHKTVHELIKVFHTTASSCVKFYNAKATNSHVASATAWFTLKTYRTLVEKAIFTYIFQPTADLTFAIFTN